MRVARLMWWITAISSMAVVADIWLTGDVPSDAAVAAAAYSALMLAAGAALLATKRDG